MLPDGNLSTSQVAVSGGVQYLHQQQESSCQEQETGVERDKHFTEKIQQLRDYVMRLEGEKQEVMLKMEADRIELGLGEKMMSKRF